MCAKSKPELVVDVSTLTHIDIYTSRKTNSIDTRESRLELDAPKKQGSIPKLYQEPECYIMQLTRALKTIKTSEEKCKSYCLDYIHCVELSELCAYNAN